MADKLYDDLTGHITKLHKKVEYLTNKLNKETSIENIATLKQRLERTQIKYNNYLDRLKYYISFIPGVRTRECMELMYIENWTKEDISDYYYIDESVIVRELVCGRQIISALEKFNTETIKENVVI